MSWRRGIAGCVVIVVLYNLHALWPNDLAGYARGGGMEWFALQELPPWMHPRAVQRACINVSYAALLMLLLWPRERSLPILAGAWFMLQAAQVMLGGNWFPEDWPDWGTLLCLFFTWYLIRFKWPVVLKVVHRRWTSRS